MQSSWAFNSTELEKFAPCPKILAESNYPVASGFG